MKKILITGGAGYIGSHTCKLIAKAGYEPICFDNLSTGYKEFVKWGPFILGDLKNTTLLKETFKRFKPNAVIHFAGSSLVGESVINPLKYFDNNVGSTLSLLNAMKDFSVKNIIFSSTCATYGADSLAPIDESFPQIPINPYGMSKLMIERILKNLSDIKEISHISLRYFNAAGADKDSEIGESHNPETHLIPLAINSALGGKVLKVFGNDFPTKDGTAIRDYIHVEDLASAHIKALEYIIDSGKSDFINLGTGKGHSIKEILLGLKDLGLNPHTIDSPRREGDPAVLVANATKAKQILNWEPSYNIKEILASAKAWHSRS
jgi:UDP-glucose 4-epimerase